MKNFVYILNLLIVISTISCGQNSFKKELNGKWYGIENNGYTRMHFYPDSLIFTEAYRERVEWKATESQINFSLPSNMWLDSIKNVKVNYRLSKHRDTLFGTFKNLHGENKLNLIRAKNYIEYLNKRYEINFSLPENNTVEYLKPPINEAYDSYGLKVFIGYLNNKIIGKTELSENLNTIESDIISFKDSIKPNGREEVDGYDKFYDRRFHLRVFADKKISDSIITKYLSVTVKHDISEKNAYSRKPTNDTLPIRIYRIYQSEETENLQTIRGKEIKTNANNIYFEQQENL